MSEFDPLQWLSPAAMQGLKARLNVIKSTIDATPTSAAALRACYDDIVPWPKHTIASPHDPRDAEDLYDWDTAAQDVIIEA
jgi:hypothetical protein